MKNQDQYEKEKGHIKDQEENDRNLGRNNTKTKNNRKSKSKGAFSNEVMKQKMTQEHLKERYKNTREKEKWANSG